MKHFRGLLRTGVVSGLAIVNLSLTPNSFSAPGAAAAAKPDNKVDASAKAATTETPIPQAVFDLTAKHIRDPFYPNTLRQPISVVATNTPSISIASFVLKALSGPTNQRLALINNRTVAVGETAEVTTAGGSKVKIRCVDIRDTSVLIKLEGQPEPIELHLRKNF